MLMFMLMLTLMSKCEPALKGNNVIVVLIAKYNFNAAKLYSMKSQVNCKQWKLRHLTSSKTGH